MTAAQLSRRVLGLDRNPILPLDLGWQRGLAIYARRAFGVLLVGLVGLSLTVLVYAISRVPWTAAGIPVVVVLGSIVAARSSAYLLNTTDRSYGPGGLPHPGVVLGLMRVS